MLKDDARRPAAAPERPEDFLGRWSRRKRAAGKPAPAAPPVEPAAPDPAAADAAPAPDGAPERVLTDADMPPLESLHADSDVSGFLSPGVSEELRRLALRKLFRSAKFNVRDGLDDYDEDFTKFEPLGDVVTCDMRHQAEMRELRRREREEALAREGEPGEGAGESAPGADAPAPEDAPGEPAEAAPAEATAGDAGARDDDLRAQAGDESPAGADAAPGAAREGEDGDGKRDGAG